MNIIFIGGVIMIIPKKNSTVILHLSRKLQLDLMLSISKWIISMIKKI